MTKTDMQAVIAIIQDACAGDAELDVEAIDALIYEASPRVTPAEEVAAWRAYADEAKQYADRAEAEFKAFAAWVFEQRAQGRPESDLTFGAFVRARFAN